MRKKKPYVDIECTWEFSLNGRLIRLWIAEETVENEYFHEDIEEKIRLFNGEGKTRKELIEYIATIPKINAVQIKDKGFPEEGVMIYYVPF